MITTNSSSSVGLYSIAVRGLEVPDLLVWLCQMAAAMASRRG